MTGLSASQIVNVQSRKDWERKAEQIAENPFNANILELTSIWTYSSWTTRLFKLADIGESIDYSVQPEANPSIISQIYLRAAK